MAFVTVHDYVSAVHTWLMDMRGDILAVLGKIDGDDDPLADATELIVKIAWPDELMIETKESIFRQEMRMSIFNGQSGVLAYPWQLGLVDISIELGICSFFFASNFFTSGFLAIGYRSGKYRPKKTPAWERELFPEIGEYM